MPACRLRHDRELNASRMFSSGPCRIGTTLIAAHGNSLRAIVKHLDQMGDEAVVGLNIPTGIPLVYDLDDDLKPIEIGGRYLDPDAAAASIEAVKMQGRK